MASSTRARVAARTPAAPLMTRETVPTPVPEAAATSAMVARRDFGTMSPPFRPELEPLPGWNGPILGMRHLPRQGCGQVATPLNPSFVGQNGPASHPDIDIYRRIRTSSTTM